MRKASWLLIPLVMVLVFELLSRRFPPGPGQERSLHSVLFTYLESPKPSSVVLVGSSIFANVIDEEFPGVTNLGFDGANALTGLEILTQSGDRPRVVVVEMGLNSLAQSRGLHRGLMDLFEKRTEVLLRRRWLHSSRRENNLHLRLRTWVRNRSTAKKERGLSHADPVFYKRALAQYVHRQKQRTENGFYERQELKRWLQQQKDLIDTLQKDGVKVLLLRSPEAQAMREARRFEYEVEQAVFPIDQYRWLDPQASGISFASRDGIHLLRRDSIVMLAGVLERLASWSWLP